MKKCRRCGTNKPKSGFYRQRNNRDGLTNWCRPCYCARVIANRRRRFAHYQLYEKKRGEDPARYAAMLERTRAYPKRFPGRARAHQMVKEAIRNGRLIRQACEECGAARVHAHHDDYRKPLSVRWLCPMHHRRQHPGKGTVR